MTSTLIGQGLRINENRWIRKDVFERLGVEDNMTKELTDKEYIKNIRESLEKKRHLFYISVAIFLIVFVLQILMAFVYYQRMHELPVSFLEIDDQYFGIGVYIGLLSGTYVALSILVVVKGLSAIIVGKQGGLREHRLLIKYYDECDGDGRDLRAEGIGKVG